MSTSELPFRQVHLDFHTSEHIPGVGSHFSRSQFQEMLQRGHVNSVTLFAKCHHGLSYHNTEVGIRHPQLTCDLLAQQIAACQEIGVQTPLYISAGLDEAMMQRHPEWGVKHRDGKTFDPLRPGYKALCFGGPYLDYLCAQIEEVVTLFAGKTPGIFLDIISARRCYCAHCLYGMQQAGIDPTREDEVERYAQSVLQNYYRRTTAACRTINPEIRVFHNSGHIPKGAGEAFLRWNSHLELESLPTGGWGYDHFPVSAKYAATTGLDFLGMTGKFHTTWGEFGGFKRPNALRYECAAMLAFGAKCSIGDQLHPVGRMNPDTYTLIGAAYAEVAAKEPWCVGAKAISDIALVSPEALRGGSLSHGDATYAEEGAARMLLELHLLFDVIDLDADLSRYKVVILPDEIRLSGGFLEKLRVYREKGGKLLLSGASGMEKEADRFALDLGLSVEKRSAFDPDYLIATDVAPDLLVREPFVIHDGAWDVRVTGTGYQMLAARADSYFNRTWEHFCSHQHTPDAPGTSPFPGVVLSDSVAYFAHNIFTRYRQYGQPLYRDLVQAALAGLLKDPSVNVPGLPTAARVAYNYQSADQRYILHLLYAVPVKRGAAASQWASATQAVEVIEDLVPLYDITCEARVDRALSSVILEPEGQAIPFTQEGDLVRFTVPKLLCHQMVVLA